MSSILAAALAFVGLMPRNAEAVPLTAPEEQSNKPPEVPPQPQTAREASTMLVDQFIVALRERPQDFQESSHTLDDRITGMEWWIANGAGYVRLHNVRNCGCENVPFAKADQSRAWEAIERWRNTDIGAAQSPHAHEMLRLWKANAKARRH